MIELSLHILDIVENSTRSGADTVRISIMENTSKDVVTLEIHDDGSGMNEEILKQVIDPFFTTKTVRRVGLGLPLLAQAAEAAGGKFDIESTRDEGTRVTAIFKLSHIDRQPLGDMAGTMVTLIAGNTGRTFIYRHQHDGNDYLLDTREIKKELGEIAINRTEVLALISTDIKEGLREIGALA
ncbi:MAG: ATP-binding protein [Smithellaceae bacterium]|nr:ATP-binding protein [Smithellaceae bacterium]